MISIVYISEGNSGSIRTCTGSCNTIMCRDEARLLHIHGVRLCKGHRPYLLFCNNAGDQSNIVLCQQVCILILQACQFDHPQGILQPAGDQGTAPEHQLDAALPKKSAMW